MLPLVILYFSLLDVYDFRALKMALMLLFITGKGLCVITVGRVRVVYPLKVFLKLVIALALGLYPKLPLRVFGSLSVLEVWLGRLKVL